MRTPTTPSTAVDLAEARAQFDAWRSTRAAGGRIPDHLWSLAIALLSSHPATEVARQLGLHPERLAEARIWLTSRCSKRSSALVCFCIRAERRMQA